jgi:hypothetical protein
MKKINSKGKKTKNISLFIVDCTVQSTIKGIKTGKKKKKIKGISR